MWSGKDQTKSVGLSSRAWYLIKGSIPDCDTSKECLEKVVAPFTGYSKAYATIVVSDFINMKYDGNGVWAYIHKVTSIVFKLNKHLKQDLLEEFVVHVIMKSPWKEHETFHVHYNPLSRISITWTISLHIMSMKKRLKSYKGDSINYPKHTLKKKNKNPMKNFKKQGK
jgi:hypothetical protein